MWHSEDDIIKDLASLNDFGVPGDTEPYKVLYSNGRGSKKIHKSHIPKTFVDPRSGDTIDISDFTPELHNSEFKGSRGRGSALGKLARKNTQLQNQLRLARPLGSSDQIIEAYCRRNHPATSKGETQPTTSETVAKENSENKSVSPTSCSNSIEKIEKRIKGTRSSNSQSNALLSSLLSKVEITSSPNSLSGSSTYKSDDKISLKSDDEPNIDKESVSGSSDVSEISGISTKSSHETQDSVASDYSTSNFSDPSFFELERGSKSYQSSGRENESSQNDSSKVFTSVMTSSDSYLNKTMTSTRPNDFVIEENEFPPLKRK